MATVLLWSYSITYVSGGTDLSTAGPIAAPNTVVVQNVLDSESVVFISCTDSAGYGGGVDIPPASGSSANQVALRPGEASPVINIPSGYSLYANVRDATNEQATVQIWQAS
jgi:hypothetical protein